jgi:hypothetical protein
MFHKFSPLVTSLGVRREIASDKRKMFKAETEAQKIIS